MPLAPVCCYSGGVGGVHRTLSGGWEACDGCTLPMHLPDLTPVAAAAIPLELLLPILEVMQPPQFTSGDTHKIWLVGEVAHRDYDLPAVIQGDGSLLWMQHERKHRNHDLPAVIDADGRREWWRSGRRHRETGPAVVNPDGSVDYWRHGEFLYGYRKPR